MRELTKSQKKHLRLLAKDCYEKEMSLALESLSEYFKKWETREISTWDLNDKIHEYHNEIARDLWKVYESLSDPRVALSQAVIKGIIVIDEIPEDCRPLLQGLIDLYRSEK